MSGRREWVALAALVLVSAGLRAWAALAIPVPWIAPDEMVYGLLGRGLYEHGSLDILGGPTPYYSLLTPVTVGLPLTVFDLSTGYDLLQGLQALAMSLAAVPTYLWARSLVSRKWALAAAALAVAVPGLTYSGLVMTEVLFYPLLVLAAWAAAESIARPSLLNQGLLVAAVLAAAATRLQAIVLLPVFLTAVGLEAAMTRSWSAVRRLWPAAAGLTALVVAWIAWRAASGGGTLGGYAVVTTTSYSVGGALKYVVWHLADTLVLCGLFPAGAVAAMLVRALRRGETDPRVRAYLAVAASLTAWLVVEVGIFASRYSDRIVERYLMGLAPVLFVGLVLWIERGATGRVERWIVAAVAAVVVLVLPVRRLVTIYTTHDAMTLVPLYKLEQASSSRTMLVVYVVVAVVAMLVFAFAPGRVLRFVPPVLLVAFALASIVSSRFVADEARAQQRTFLGGDPRWVDHAAAKRVAYLYDAEPSWNGVWETLFWNSHIDRVYDLSPIAVPGPLPQTEVETEGDGTVFVPPSKLKEAKYTIASNWIELRGDRVAQIQQEGLTQTGLALWKLDRPLRILTRVTGLQPNGDVYGATRGRLTAYACNNGRFAVTLIIKEPETVDIRLNGRLVKHLAFRAPQPSWHGEFPVTGHGGGVCTFDVAPSGLVGTTVFTFERG